MNDTKHDRGGVLRRMLGEGARPKPPPLTVHRALRLTLGQLADERFDTEVEVRGVEDQRISQDALADIRLPNGVTFLIEGPHGAVGLAIASRDLVAALIEVQTTGGISNTPGPDRAPTATDAAMAEGYVDAALVRLGTMLSEVEGEEWTRGHRLGRPVFDLHQITLELPDISYRLLRAAIGFGAEGKQGELVIALPADPGSLPRADLGQQAADAAQLWQRQLRASVLECTVGLDAVLHRLRLPVASVRALKAGDTIAVPARAVRAVTVEGADHRRVAVGRLGMTGGMKAIRLSEIGRDKLPGPAWEEAQESEFERAIDLDGLGLGAFPDPTPPSALTSPLLAEPVLTPDDLPDLGNEAGSDALPSPPRPVAGPLPPPDMSLGLESLEEDGTIPLDDLPELGDDLPQIDIKPMTLEID